MLHLGVRVSELHYLMHRGPDAARCLLLLCCHLPPQGEVVLVRQTDQPGIIAAVSSEFAKNSINISFMTVRWVLGAGAGGAGLAALCRLPMLHMICVRWGVVLRSSPTLPSLLHPLTLPHSAAAAPALLRHTACSRVSKGNDALMAIGVDEAPGAAVLAAIQSVRGIQEVTVFSEKRAA